MVRIGAANNNVSQQSIATNNRSDGGFGAKLRAGLKLNAASVSGAVGAQSNPVVGSSIVNAALAKAGGGLGTSSHGLSAAGGAGNAVPTLGSGATPNIPGISHGSNVDKQMAQTKALTEMQASFNLQFLRLQQKIGHESKTFQTVSNIMKNRGDTAKNSIRNMS